MFAAAAANILEIRPINPTRGETMPLDNRLQTSQVKFLPLAAIK